MFYKQTECPHCGNEITVKNVEEEQKCKWCRRLLKAIFKRRKNGKLVLVDVIPVEFKLNETNYTSPRKF